MPFRPRPRFSLMSFVLGTSLVCVSVSHWQLSKRSASLEEANRQFRNELGFLQVNDSTKAYVRQLASTDGMTRKFRIHLPTDRKYELHEVWQWGNGQFPKSTRGNITRDLPTGEFLLTVTFRKLAGKWRYSVQLPSGGYGRPTWGDVRWIRDSDLEPIHMQQRESPSDEPIEVFRTTDVRPGAEDSGPTSGLLLWINPIDADSADYRAGGKSLTTRVASSDWEQVGGEEKEQEKQAAVLVRELGGKAHFRGGRLVSVSVGSLPFTDSHLEQLEGLANLESLYLRRTNVTDSGMRHLRGMTGLQSLLLPGTEVGDAGIEQIQNLTHLNGLYLAGTNITDAGLAHLESMAELQTLHLDNTEIGDPGMTQIAKLLSLERLHLKQTRLTDAGLASVVRLERLQHIDLCGTTVTDAGVRRLMRALPGLLVRRLDEGQETALEKMRKRSRRSRIVANGQGDISGGRRNVVKLSANGETFTNFSLEPVKALKQLRSLSLSDTEINDAGLAHLRGLNRIALLQLDGTQITDEGLKRIAELDCKLQSLVLSDTCITDAGLQRLARQSELRWLDLSGTLVTDAGMEHLLALSKLGSLSVMDTKVSNRGIRRLQSAIPTIQIRR